MKAIADLGLHAPPKTQIPMACWQLQPAPQPQSKDEPMADASTETEMPNATHSDWLENVLMAEDGPPPTPVLFVGNPKAEQLALVRVIGDRLRQARELCNLSQSVAAKRLGYSNSSKLSKVEGATDTNSVPLWLILRAARVYEVSVDFLFGLTDEWETDVPRGTQEWLLNVWQKLRERDMAALDQLHREIVAVSRHTAALVAGVREVAEGLSTYRARNPGFDETPASATLAGRLERLQAGARDADTALKRLRLGAAGGASEDVR